MESSNIQPVPITEWKQYWQRCNQTNTKQSPVQLPKAVLSTEQMIPLQVGNSFYIIMDYQAKQFVEVGGNSTQVIGYTPEELMHGGFALLSALVWPESLPKVAAAGFFYHEFIHQQPVTKRLHLKTNLNIWMQHKLGTQLVLLEQVLILALDANGQVSHTFKHFTDISHLPTATEMVLSFLDIEHGHNHATLYHTVSFAQTVAEEKKLDLSKAELNVLKLIAKGLASKEIACQLHISVHTVNNHRKNMIKKAKARNITEVLNIALLNEMM